MGTVYRVECAVCRMLHLGPDIGAARARADVHRRASGHDVIVRDLSETLEGDEA